LISGGDDFPHPLKIAAASMKPSKKREPSRIVRIINVSSSRV
jgi:hypothetical protein